jgi:hypothetical protein
VYAVRCSFALAQRALTASAEADALLPCALEPAAIARAQGDLAAAISSRCV